MPISLSGFKNNVLSLRNLILTFNCDVFLAVNFTLNNEALCVLQAWDISEHLDKLVNWLINNDRGQLVTGLLQYKVTVNGEAITLQ